MLLTRLHIQRTGIAHRQNQTHHPHHHQRTGPCKTARRRLHKRSQPQALPPHAAAAATLAAAVAPICFDQECQANADRSFLLATAVPILLAIAAAAYVARPPPQQLRDSGQVFEDDSTGSLFEVPDKDTAPERDKDGLLVFSPWSYTPQPVAADFEGERLRIPVGPIRDRKLRTYAFKRRLQQPSELIAVTLPRPLGVVFEYDKARKRAAVVELVEGSAAAQRQRMAGLNRGLAKESVQPGDVLRGVTCTNFVYPTQALFGAVAPERHIVVYGADQQSWASIRTALRKGEVKDGDVTLIMERRILPATAPAAAAAAVPAAAATSSFDSSLFADDPAAATTTAAAAETPADVLRSAPSLHIHTQLQPPHSCSAPPTYNRPVVPRPAPGPPTVAAASTQRSAWPSPLPATCSAADPSSSSSSSPDACSSASQQQPLLRLRGRSQAVAAATHTAAAPSGSKHPCGGGSCCCCVVAQCASLVNIKLAELQIEGVGNIRQPPEAAAWLHCCRRATAASSQQWLCRVAVSVWPCADLWGHQAAQGCG